MEELRDVMKAPLPLLDRVGSFELFAPEEWMNDAGKNEGGRVVRVAAGVQGGLETITLPIIRSPLIS